MTSAMSALLALLLVCSLPAMTVVATGPEPRDGDGDDSGATVQFTAQQSSPVEVDDTANRLELVDPQRGGTVEHSRDLGSALASSDDAIRVDHERYAVLDSEFSTATADEREQLLDDAFDTVLDRIEALETREQQAVEEHAAGDRSDTELLAVLVRNNQEAAALSESLAELSDRADRVPGYSLSVSDEQSQLAVYQTDLRTELDATMRGADPEPMLVTLQTSETGYTVSTIGTTYIQETVRFDNRDLDRPNQFDSFTDADDAAVELYPWVFETGGSSGAAEYEAVQLYWVRSSHDHGQLETYFDGGTGDVYRELHEIDYNSLPTTNTEQWENDTLTLEIDQTPLNGPTEVSVTDVETNETEPATITVDGIEVGEITDDDETVWYVPPSDEYELDAETDAGTINATVSGV